MTAVPPAPLHTAAAWRRPFTALGKKVLLAGGTILLALFAWRWLAFQGPYAIPEPLPDTPLIDMHCHIAGLGSRGSGCYVSPRLRNSWKFRLYLRAFGVAEEELLSQGDELLVTRLAERLARGRHVISAVILALDGVIDAHGKLDYAASEVYIPNEYVAAQARRNHNLYFGASINPHRSDALAQLEQAAQSGAVLVKWIPSIMGIDPAQERLRPFYESLQRLGLPLLTHTGEERSFSSAQDQLADPLRLELPLRLGVTVIAAHCGSGGSIEGQRHLDRLQQMMRRYPNLWADISSLTQINRLGYLKEVLAAPEFRDRLLFGSDFPLINTPLVSAWYFPLQLSLRQIWGISRLDSPWDRDLQMKQNLGVPAAVFSAANRLLRLQAGKK